MTQAQTQQGVGRAKNVIQAYLIRKLVVPKVYLDAELNGTSVDVLAIDRAGVGDVHAVRMVPHQDPNGGGEDYPKWKPNAQETDAKLSEESAMDKVRDEVLVAIKEVSSFQSHYRYVAVVSDELDLRKFSPGDSIEHDSFAEDGVGRIGILYVDLSEDDPKFQVRVILKPERFRSSKEIIDLADKFVAEHTANWEIRG